MRKTAFLSFVFLLATVFLPVFLHSATGNIVFVDCAANGANNGISWDGAYNFLQDALADANSSEKPIEIRVAQGIYKPDQGANQVPGDREVAFQLMSSVTLKGGFAGFGSSDPNARDIGKYETILSGDLNSDDERVGDPNDLLNEPSRSENSYHVVTASSTNQDANLDGFTVIAGNENRGSESSDPWVKGNGGGMYIDSGEPTLVDCTFVTNPRVILHWLVLRQRIP